MLFNRRNTEDIKVIQRRLSGVLGRIEKLETVPRPPVDFTDLRERIDNAIATVTDRVDELTVAHQELRDGHKDLILAVSEGIERTERAERRVQATVKRARKELSERGLSDPGLEAENQELSDIDGDRGGNGEVPAVRAPVAPVAPQASSVPGVPLDTMARFRGLR